VGFGSLRRDPVVLVTVGMFLVLSLPLVFPIFSTGFTRIYANAATSLPFLALILVAFRWGLARSDARARRFWNLMTAAIDCWIVQQLIVLGNEASAWSVDTSLAEDLLYVGMYMFIVLALDVRPHEPGGEGDRGALAALRRSGTVVFLFGMLVYLVAVPNAVAPGSFRNWMPSFLLYFVLDCYLVLRAAGVLAATPANPWRPVYLWLQATFSLWLVLDVVEGLTWIKILPWIRSPSPWDLLWFLPLMTLVAAGRSRQPVEETVPRLDREATAAHGLTPLPGGPLILTAMLVPLVHFGLYSLGVFGAATRGAHELTALVLLVVLGGLVLAYQRILEARNRRLDRERREALARIEHDAYHDPLTDLPNRRLLWDRLGRAMANATRRDEPLAVLFFDLDGFKAVNDSVGHAVGDQLLREVGKRLELSVRASDTIARLGGDEFVVVAPGVGSSEIAIFLATKIQRSLRKPFRIGEADLRIDASVGISLFPENGEDQESLLWYADKAMYEAKQEQSGTIRVAASRRDPSS
jgi:diguanylate cyclase (GGDEF)-like protein